MFKRKEANWYKFPRTKPTEEGWYYTTVTIWKDEDSENSYGRELYWNGSRWMDNIRLNMCELYDIKSNITNESLNAELKKNCDWTKYVVAWMKLPSIIKIN